MSLFHPSLISSGTVEVNSGTLRLEGGGLAFTGGNLKFGFSGTNTFGNLVATSPVSLAGAITGTLASDVAPESGTVFQVMTFPSRTGTFTNEGQSFYAANGRGFIPVVSDTSVSLVTIVTNIGFPPIVASQPLGGTYPLGGTATLTVAVNGSSPLSYQWMLNGTPFQDSAKVSGARSNYLTLTNLQLTDAGAYSVLVSNIAGSTVSSQAVLVVDAPPTISLIVGQPGITTFQLGWQTAAPATFEVHYGLTTNYGFLASSDHVLRTNHAVTLTGLAAGTTYHYQIRAFNVVSNRAVTADAVFTTDPAPDLQISGLSVLPITNRYSGVVVTALWTNRNFGTATAAGPWHDRLVVSNSTLGQVVLATNVPFNVPLGGGIPPGSSALNQCNFRLPDGEPGVGLLVFTVTADINNTVIEYNSAGTAELNNSFSMSRNSEWPPYPDLEILNINAPTVGMPGQIIPVTWAITNKGSGDASSIRYDALRLSVDAQIGNDELLQVFEFSEMIPAGAFLNVTQNVILPVGLIGDRYFTVTVNESNRIYEVVTTNNTRLGPRISPSNPDLIPVALSAPGSAQLGQTISVEWSVQNAGTAPANSAWSDTVYLSTTSNSLNGAAVLAARTAPNALLPGALYTNALLLPLPSPNDLAAGNYFLTVFTDQTAVQPESSEQNNIVSRPIQLTLPPLSDLSATNVFIPVAAKPGESVNVSWILTNLGAATAYALLSESLTLSTNVGSLDGILLAFTTITNSIPPLGSLQRTQQVTIPANVSGNFFLVVSVDAQNTIAESNESNNLAAAASPLIVVPGLTLELPITQISENAANPTFQATVRRNGSLSGSLAVQILNGNTNELAVPDSLLIPPGQGGAAFNISVVRDLMVDSNKLVSIAVSAPGFSGATGQVMVVNTDLPRLTVTTTNSTIVEGEVSLATISRDSSTEHDLAVTLVSSSQANLLTSGSAVILAGQTSVTVPVLAVDDATVEQSRTFALTASAGGHASGSVSFTILDNDAPALTLSLAGDSVPESAGSYATTGTLRRESSSGSVYIRLSSGEPSAALVPSTLQMSDGQREITFPITTVDDLIVDGPQVTTISAVAIDAIQAQPVGSPVSRQLTITDDDGPTLTLSVSKKVVAEGLTPATRATLRRNTSTNVALTVNISSSATGEALVPAAITIPVGENAASFDINTLQDGVTDGSQMVTISANADGFTGASTTLLVTDADLPDLIVDGIVSPVSAETEGSLTITYRVSNQGFALAASNFVTRVYLSADPVGDKGILVDEYTNQTAVAAGAFFSRTIQIAAPSQVGAYWLVVDTDVLHDVNEVLEDNNFLLATNSLSVQPSYRATVQADNPTALPGTPIALRGQAIVPSSGMPLANVPVNLHVRVGSITRIISVLTDQNGNFVGTFTPVSGESGNFIVIASHPGELNPADNGNGNTTSFALLGMKLEIPNAYQILVEHEPWTNRFTVRNLSGFPLTGLTVEVLQKPDNITVNSASLESGSTLPANGVNSLMVQLLAENVSNTLGEIWVRIRSDQGVSVQERIYTSISPQRAQLAASTTALSASMVRGTVRTVEFNIRNVGAAPTGPMTLLLPPVPWLSSPLGQTLPSLNPGETRTISLTLSPSFDLPLTLHQGSLALNCATTQLLLPFSFRCVSDSSAALLVSTVDEFFYYGTGSPRLTNALVRVLDPFTSEERARTNSDANGFAFFPGLNEGYYSLEVSAPSHSTYKNTVNLQPGITNEFETFLPRQVVTYVWTVEPVEIEERVTISVNAIFETFVPKPVIVVTPTLIDLSLLTRPGQTMQVDIKMANHGIIGWQGVNLDFQDNPEYEIVPLIKDVGIIPAHSEVTVPVLARRKESAGLAGRTKSVKSASYDPCKVFGWVQGWYPCGPNQVKDATSLQGYWYCSPPTPTPPPPPPQTDLPPTPPNQPPPSSFGPSYGSYSPIQVDTEEKCCTASVSGPSEGFMGEIVAFTGTGGPPGGTYSWSVSGGATIQSGQGTSNLRVKLGNSEGTVRVRLTYTPKGAQRVCGFDHTVNVRCPQITFNPNPPRAIAIGGSGTIGVSITPSSAQSLVSFDTANEAIATASGGGSSVTVNGISAGSTSVRAKVNGHVCASVPVRVVEVASLTPNEGEEIDDGDDDPDTKVYIVCKAASGNVTVTAVPNPVTAEVDLPAAWSLTGGTGAGKLSRVVSKTVVGNTFIQAACGTSRKTLTIRIVDSALTFASGETANHFLGAFQDGNSIASETDFRFLVGEGRTITVRYMTCQSGQAGPFTCEIASVGSGSVPPSVTSALMTGGELTFTPLATSANRPLTEAAIPPVAYLITIKGASGNILTNTIISQDLKDRIRQEYIDAYLRHGSAFTSGSVGLVNHAPPRSQVIIASERDLGGPGPVGTCRDWPNPNYYGPGSGNGMIWDQGFTALVQTLRSAMLPDIVCVHSGHRSPSHNRRFNGVVNSDHQWGRAADMSYAASFSATVAHAKFHLRLYRAALGATSGQVLLENNAHQRLPSRWNPPPANYTFHPGSADSDWSVSFVDIDGDDLPDQVSQVTGQIPIATALTWDGGGTSNPDFNIVDNDGNGRVSVGDTLVLNYDGVHTLYERFSGATHVHAEAD